MKKGILFLLLLSALIEVNATPAMPDYIVLDGKGWKFMAKPVNLAPVCQEMLVQYLPENRIVTSANWDGYLCEWVIKNDSLYLHRVTFEMEIGAKIAVDTDSLYKIFRPYLTHDGICASWFSGEVRAGRGDMVRYSEYSFMSYYETEYVLKIENGGIAHMELYHNRTIDGYDYDNIIKGVSKRFDYDDFPGLDGRLLVECNVVGITSGGIVTDIECRPLRVDGKLPPNKIKEMMKKIEETLKSIRPWKRYCLNGDTVWFLDGYRLVLPIVRNRLKACAKNGKLNAGEDVCYINTFGDTIVPFGRYKYCCHDTIEGIGFVYNNKGDIICIDNSGNELAKVFKCGNRPDMEQDGFFRIVDDNGLIGYADMSGCITIKPQFRYANPFKNGRA